jgi:hypothetical protein
MSIPLIRNHFLDKRANTNKYYLVTYSSVLLTWTPGAHQKQQPQPDHPRWKSSPNPGSRTSWCHETILWELFFGLMGFEFWASCLCRCSSLWGNPPALFCVCCFMIKISWINCPGGLQSAIILISASWVCIFNWKKRHVGLKCMQRSMRRQWY